MDLARRIYSSVMLLAMVGLAVGAWLVHGSSREFSAQVVLTGSMEPAVPRGSLAITRALESGAYGPGDIVTFDDPWNRKAYITHRIMRRAQLSDGTEAVATKGDANTNGDLDLVPLERVKGRVFLVVPKFGYLMAFLKTPAGFLIVAGITFFCFVLFELYGVLVYFERMLSRLRAAKQARRLH